MNVWRMFICNGAHLHTIAAAVVPANYQLAFCTRESHTVHRLGDVKNVPATTLDCNHVTIGRCSGAWNRDPRSLDRRLQCVLKVDTLCHGQLTQRCVTGSCKSIHSPVTRTSVVSEIMVEGRVENKELTDRSCLDQPWWMQS